MSPLYRKFASALLAGLLVFGICHYSAAQDETPKTTLRVYQLSPDDNFAFDVLSELLQNQSDVRMQIGGGNRLVVSGSDAIHSVVKETLAAMKSDPEESREHVAVFQLAHSDANEIARSLGSLIKDKIQMSVDYRMNSIIVVAQKQKLEFIEGLIKQLDVRPEGAAGQNADDCMVRVAWLVDPSKLAESDRKLLRPVPKDFSAVVSELVKNQSITGGLVMTEVQSLTSSSDGGGVEAVFENSSTTELDTIGDISLSASGGVEAEKGGRYRVSIQVEMASSDSPEPKGFESVFSVANDHPVAFSISELNGIPSVLIIQIKRKSPLPKK